MDTACLATDEYYDFVQRIWIEKYQEEGNSAECNATIVVSV